jgi:hypothetical protein
MFGTRGAHPGDRCREGHSGGALHVVVEGAQVRRVAVEDPPGVGDPEVLPVQQCVGERAPRGLDVGVDESVVALPADSGVACAQVHGVREQGLVVRPDVKDDRQDPPGMDPGRGDVDGELADGDLDAPDALVADPEDPLGVGGDDEVDFVSAPSEVLQGLLDLLGVVDRQKDAARAAVLVAVAFDGLPDRRGVDDGQHLVEVLAEQPVEQHLVAVAQRRQVEVLREVIPLPAVLGVDPCDLGVDGGYTFGEQPDQAELASLLGGEGGTTKDQRLSHKAVASSTHAVDGPGVGLDDLVRLIHGGSVLLVPVAPGAGCF